MKLAEALLRRKELQEKVSRIGAITEKGLFEFRFERKAATEGMDDIKAMVPKCTLAEVTQEYDHYSKRLRLVDATIQQANWTTELTEADPCIMDDFPLSETKRK